MTNSEMLRATNNEDLIPSYEIKDTDMAIKRMNDIIRALHNNGFTGALTEQLDEIRQFIGRDM